MPFSGALHGEPVRVHRIHGEKSEQNQGDLRGDEHILVDGFAMAAAHVIDRHHPASPLSFSFTLAAARGTCLGPSAPARPLPPAALAAAAGPGPGVWVVLGHFCALVDTVACTLHRDRRTHGHALSVCLSARTLHRHYFATRAAWCDRVDPRPLVWARPNSHRRPAWMLGLPGRRSSEPKRGICSGRVAKRPWEAEKRPGRK